MRTSLIALVVSAGLLGCQTVETTKQGTVGVDRQQRMMVSEQEVNASAQKQYAQMMAEAQKKNALDRDAAQVARVKAITSRLVPQTAVFRPDAQKWAWEVHVLTLNDVNAWCMPGGKMAVYSGLIEKLQATDDELAAVMGHEIAHALREHGRERVSQQLAKGAPERVKPAVDALLRTDLGLKSSGDSQMLVERLVVELTGRPVPRPQWGPGRR